MLLEERNERGMRFEGDRKVETIQTQRAHQHLCHCLCLAHIPYFGSLLELRSRGFCEPVRHWKLRACHLLCFSILETCGPVHLTMVRLSGIHLHAAFLPLLKWPSCILLPMGLRVLKEKTILKILTSKGENWFNWKDSRFTILHPWS